MEKDHKTQQDSKDPSDNIKQELKGDSAEVNDNYQKLDKKGQSSRVNKSKNEKRRRDQDKHKTKEDEISKAYASYNIPMIPFRHGMHSYYYPYGGYSGFYPYGHGLEVPQDSESISEATSSEEEENSDREKNRVQQKRSQLNDSSSSIEKDFNPRLYDTKLPHEVGHHHFHLPPKNLPPHHNQVWRGYPQQPHPQVFGLSNPYMPPVHCPCQCPTMNPYAMWNQGFKHYPGHFFSPHHGEIATSDAVYYGKHQGGPGLRHYPGHFFAPHPFDVAMADAVYYGKGKNKDKKRRRKAKKTIKESETIEGQHPESKDGKDLKTSK